MPPPDNWRSDPGGGRNAVSGLTIPFQSGSFINNAVEGFQQEWASGNLYDFSDPLTVRSPEIGSTSIGEGLGLDDSVFVQHAVRVSQTHGQFLDNLVNGRRSRVNLSSDRAIPTPELFQPGAFDNFTAAEKSPVPDRTVPLPVGVDLPKDEALVKTEPNAPGKRSAPSFSEQLRGDGSRTPVVARKPLSSRVTLS